MPDIPSTEADDPISATPDNEDLLTDKDFNSVEREGGFDATTTYNARIKRFVDSQSDAVARPDSEVAETESAKTRH